MRGSWNLNWVEACAIVPGSPSRIQDLEAKYITISKNMWNVCSRVWVVCISGCVYVCVGMRERVPAQIASIIYDPQRSLMLLRMTITIRKLSI